MKKCMRVIFKNSKDEIRFLGLTYDEPDSREHAFKMIHRFLSNYPNFKSYYTKVNGPFTDHTLCQANEKVWQYDVGSWSEFFYVIETDLTWAEKDDPDEYSRNSIEMFEVKAK